MQLIDELKRRNVFKVAASYAIVAWIVLQVADTTFPALNIPAWVLSLLTILFLLGFPIALFLAWAYEMTPEGIKPTTEVPVQDSIRAQTGQKMNFLLLGGIALLLVVVALDAFVLEAPSAAPPVLLETSATDLGVIPEKSIAVLPFVDLSENKDQEYFTDGLSEELLNRLARVQDLQVAARTSSFYFKGRNEDMRTIGEQLGVAYILEGSVRKASESLRITTQLVRAADGFQVFSESYDRTLEDIFAIQEEIAQAVTTTLSVSLAAGEFNRPGMTRNVQAYDAYLQRNNIPGGNVLQVIDALKQAVAIDPEFALAWNALYQAYELSTIELPAAVSADFNEAKLEALQRTGALIPDAPEYLVSHAMSERRQGHWQQAEQLFLQVLTEFGNSDAMANLNYGEFLWSVGRVNEALPYLQRARRLDPKAVDVATRLGAALFSVGQPQTALAEAERGRALAPRNGFVNFTYQSALLGLGEFGRVVDEMQQNNAAPPVLQLMQALQARGEDATAVPAALENFRAALAGSNLSPASNTALGTYVAIAGDADYALTFFSAAANGNIRDIFGALMIWQPYMSDMRKLPGFKDLARDAGIVDYWRTTGNWSDFCRPVNDDFECF